jgi:hypothetical protein
MKMHLFFLVLLISSTLFAQQRDTVFIKRTVADTPYPFYHAVFIDTTSESRNALTSFAFDKYDSATYFDQLASLRTLKYSKVSLLKGLPKKWIALYKWKNEYHLYHPSDFGNHYKFEITDSTTIDFTMEGAEPSRLNKVSFLSPTRISVYRSNYWRSKKVQIDIIDKIKGIAVFTISPNKYRKKAHKVLMVDATKAHLFPVIVNYCETDKQAEFEFDKIKL